MGKRKTKNYKKRIMRECYDLVCRRVGGGDGGGVACVFFSCVTCVYVYNQKCKKFYLYHGHIFTFSEMSCRPLILALRF